MLTHSTIPVPVDHPSSEIRISPLTFVQIVQAAQPVMRALRERDVAIQHLYERAPRMMSLATSVFVPIGLHWLTSGFGAFMGEKPVGWLFMRRRGLPGALYIEILAVSPDARRQGVGRALLRFAESRARMLHRDWLGLTVTVSNEPAIALYESEDYQRGQWQQFVHGSPATLPDAEHAAFDLYPVKGRAARRAFRQFRRRDLDAGEAGTGLLQDRLLGREDEFGRSGKHWVVMHNGEAVAYLNRYQSGSPSISQLYLAADKAWWGSTTLRDAVKLAIVPVRQDSDQIRLRLGSTAHYNAACDTLLALGFEEQEIARTKMFKRIHDHTHEGLAS